MNKRYAAVIAAAVIIFSGCGNVTEPEGQKNENGLKAVATANEVITTNDEESSVNEENKEPEEPNEPDTETTAELEDYDFQQYYDYIVGDGAFGFELYNMGHIRESWDNRMAAAWLLLEGMALPGTENRAVDTEVSVEELNALETDGFMLNMKFEDNKTFRVGSEKIEGCGVNLIGYENSFIFCIEYFDENGEFTNTPYYELEINYIPMIVDAAQYGKTVEEAKANAPIFTDTETDTQPEPQESQPDTQQVEAQQDGDIFDKENGIVCRVLYDGGYLTENVDTAKILNIALEALADDATVGQMVTNTIDSGIRRSRQDGMYIYIAFAEFPDSDGYLLQPREIVFGNGSFIQNDNTEVKYKEAKYIQIYGKDDRYGIGVNGGSEMVLSPKYGERILQEGLGI